MCFIRGPTDDHIYPELIAHELLLFAVVFAIISPSLQLVTVDRLAVWRPLS